MPPHPKKKTNSLDKIKSNLIKNPTPFPFFLHTPNQKSIPLRWAFLKFLRHPSEITVTPLKNPLISNRALAGAGYTHAHCVSTSNNARMPQLRQSGANGSRNGVVSDHLPLSLRGGSRQFHHRRSKAPPPYKISLGFCVLILALILSISAFFYFALQSKGLWVISPVLVSFYCWKFWRLTN